ncbi:MAG: hypothetical protein JXQ69_03655 [Paludibacteraceae bacterium]|nr:hypothetical protein [Paludibacteraceae bacterium]
MAEVTMKKTVDWRTTMLDMSIGEEKKFKKNYFGKLQNVRQAASRLKEKGNWIVSADTDAMTFLIKRES